MKTNIIGVDVGGTKCAVTYGQKEGFELHIREKIRFATTDVDETIANIVRAVDDVMRKNGLTAGNTAAIGVSCGGPYRRSDVAAEFAWLGQHPDRQVVGRSFRYPYGDS